MKKMQKDPSMLEGYDFSEAVQGKYAKRYEQGTNVIVIEPDVAKTFSDSAVVNEALNASIKRGVQDAKNKKGRFVA
ncbi:MAG: hypothetical protein ABFD45_01895 [Smithella sp.]